MPPMIKICKAIAIWGLTQDSQRWDIFRLNNLSHNTLSFGGQLHRVDGRAEIAHFSGGEHPSAIVDLSPVFAGQAGRVRRGFSFQPGGGVLIRDEITGMIEQSVRWAMVTRAECELVDGGREVVLRESGKSLRVRLVSPADASFRVRPAEPPKDGFNAPNPDTRILTVTVPRPESGELTLQVQLESGCGVEKNPLTDVPLAEWPTTAVVPSL